MSVGSDDTGTTVSKSATGNGYYVANQNNISDFVFEAPFCCEVEIITANNVRFQTPNNNQSVSLNDGDIIKIEVADGYYTLTRNGVKSTPVSAPKTTDQIRFQMIGVSSVKYKDFKVYPI